jgi:hypothetical protein
MRGDGRERRCLLAEPAPERAGKLLARQGEAAMAEDLGREAVAVVEPTDFLFMRCIALLNLGETLHLAGRLQDAQAVLQDAADLCVRKGFTVGANRARALMG